jgi:hypothetical protein
MQLRAIAYWAKIDPELGARVAAGLGKTNGNANGSAEASAIVAGRANRA